MDKTGTTQTFTTTDTTLLRRNGQTVKIIRQLTDSECDTFDVGPMWKAQFDDGEVIDAFDDELSA